MVEDDKRPDRYARQVEDREEVDYFFHIDLTVRGQTLDERRVRQMIDDEFHKLAMALKYSR